MRLDFGGLAIVLCMAWVSPSSAFAPQPTKTAVVVKQAIMRCHLPANTASVHGDEVQLTPSPTSDFNRIDCLMRALQKAGVTKLGFIGNEADPNQALLHSETYFASGPTAQIAMLQDAANVAHWIIVATAHASDGNNYLVFATRPRETIGGVDKLLGRVYAKEFGDIAFGRAPKKLSERTDEDQ